MGLFDFLTKKPAQAQVNTASQPKKLKPIDVERELVQAVTTQDMIQFTAMPYQLDCEVKHYVQDGAHPFAYIDLNSANRKAAKEALQFIDAFIRKSPLLSRQIPSGIHIPIEEMYFTPNKQTGYTRIMCTPYTKTGKKSKYPLYLHFTTDLRILDHETHGQLYYAQDGSIGKANVYVWINHVGYLYYFKTIGKTLVIDKIESNAGLSRGDMPVVIYKHE